MLHSFLDFCMQLIFSVCPNEHLTFQIETVHNNFVLADLSFSFLSSYLVYSADPRETVEDKCPVKPKPTMG